MVGSPWPACGKRCGLLQFLLLTNDIQSPAPEGQGPGLQAGAEPPLGTACRPAGPWPRGLTALTYEQASVLGGTQGQVSSDVLEGSVLYQ